MNKKVSTPKKVPLSTRVKRSVSSFKERVWPWPLVSVLASAIAGASVTFLLTPRKDFDEEIRKLAADRVLKDVRESKDATPQSVQSFQAALDAYYAKRRERDAVVLDSSLSSLEKVARAQAHERALMEAEKAVYLQELARVANRRTLFLEFVINRPETPVLATSGAAHGNGTQGRTAQ